MYHVKRLFPIFLLALLSSCSRSYELMETNKVEDVFIMNSSSTFKGYYYQGSDSAYHYFVSKWDYSKDKYFKLRKKDLYIKSPFDLDRNEIRIDVFKTDMEFGRNEFCALFVVEQ